MQLPPVFQREHILQIALSRLVELRHPLVAPRNPQDVADEAVEIGRTVENHRLLAVVHRPPPDAQSLALSACSGQQNVRPRSSPQASAASEQPVSARRHCGFIWNKSMVFPTSYEKAF